MAVNFYRLLPLACSPRLHLRPTIFFTSSEGPQMVICDCGNLAIAQSSWTILNPGCRFHSYPQPIVEI
ncbi:hypothetical protein R6Q59_006009 [Mikania micrantha]